MFGRSVQPHVLYILQVHLNRDPQKKKRPSTALTHDLRSKQQSRKLFFFFLINVNKETKLMK